MTAAEIMAELDEHFGGPWAICPRCLAGELRERGVPEPDIDRIIAEAQDETSRHTPGPGDEYPASAGGYRGNPGSAARRQGCAPGRAGRVSPAGNSDLGHGQKRED